MTRVTRLHLRSCQKVSVRIRGNFVRFLFTVSNSVNPGFLFVYAGQPRKKGDICRKIKN